VNEIRDQFTADLANARSPREVEAVRIKYLGRKGLVTALAKTTDFSQWGPEERREFGKQLNELKAFVEAEVARAAEAAKAGPGAADAAGPKLELTLPGTGHSVGCMHPIALVQMELEDIFQGMGFMVLTGPEVELEYYNFDALNIPGDHPARDMQDTFWLTNGMLLRTHTSANQVRALERFGARRCGRSFRAGASATRPSTPATRTPSTSWRDCWSTATSPWPT